MSHPPIVLIAGGTGLVGKRLSSILQQQGYTVRLLTRQPKSEGQFFWNPATNEIDPNALSGVTTVINLAGAGIADQRWTASRKKELIESRGKSALLLAHAIQQSPSKPEVYLSASAIGFYGNSGEAWMLEDSAPVDHSFMVDCCQQWEAAADTIAAMGIRTLKFRIGVVLALEGGALAEIVKPLRFGLGAYFSDGQAWWSWIHLDDVCRAFVWGMETPSAQGAYNLTAPEPVRGKALVQATAKAMKQWAVFLPAPAFVLRLLLGEMSAVVLNSNRVSSKKLEQAGFEFKWPALEAAVSDIFAG